MDINDLPMPTAITLTLETHHLEDWRAIAAELRCESIEQFVAWTVDAKVAVLRARIRDRELI